MDRNIRREPELAGDYRVEIWFRIQKDKDGYPRSKAWEQLLARPLMERDDHFQICSIPFYLKNVSLGDVVRAKVVVNEEIQDGEVFEFDRTVAPGGHNTYRLLLRRKQPTDPEFTISELLSKGLAVEEQGGNFLAVDVPPSVNQQVIDEFLVAETKSGRWEMQDGYLQSMNVQPKG